MLETSLFESSGSARTRKPATVLVSTALHALLVLVLLLVPLAQPQALPRLATAIGLPVPIVQAKAEPKREIATPAAAVQPRIIPDPAAFIAPERIPADIAHVVDDPTAEITTAPAISRSTGIRSLLNNIVPTEESRTPPPPPPPPPAAPVTAPIRVGGQVQQANLIHQVAPQYPALARAARVHGVVILEATISRDGDVRDIRVITGHPLLNDAAINAVQQWKYKPTFLNGEPLEVITTVTINFTLQ